MRFMKITLAAAGVAIAAASTAAAQVSPSPSYQQPRYGQPATGVNGWLFNFRDQRYARMMRDRVQRLRHDIRQMAATRILSRSEARELDQQARTIQNRIIRFAQAGVSNAEARRIDNQVRRLEVRITREANDWNRRPGVRRYTVYNYDQYQNYYGRR